MVFPSGASVSVLIFCNSCKWVPQLSSVWKDGSQNHTVIVGKGSNTQKCWQGKARQGKSITKQKNTSVDHSGNNTVLSECKLFINSTIIFSCGLYVKKKYVKYIIQVSTKWTLRCILYDSSYFGQIINILQILKGGVNFWPQLYILYISIYLNLYYGYILWKILDFFRTVR